MVLSADETVSLVLLTQHRETANTIDFDAFLFRLPNNAGSGAVATLSTKTETVRSGKDTDTSSLAMDSAAITRVRDNLLLMWF